MKSLRAWWNSLHEATQADIISAIAVVVMIILSLLFGVIAPRFAGIA